MSKSPLRVLITGAAGQIAYSLIPLVCRGDVFGPEQAIILHLLDIAPMAGVLAGVVLEITDCAYPLVASVVATVVEEEAFKSIDAAFLVGSMPRREGMERKDLLAANVKIFASQGKALAAHSHPDVKVLVVGNPANTNALICSKFAAPKIPVTAFTAMTRLDENRARAQTAIKHGVPVASLSGVYIWGNHSSTQFPDVSNATSAGTKLPFDQHDPEFISVSFFVTTMLLLMMIKRHPFLNTHTGDPKTRSSSDCGAQTLVRDVSSESGCGPHARLVAGKHDSRVHGRHFGRQQVWRSSRRHLLLPLHRGRRQVDHCGRPDAQRRGKGEDQSHGPGAGGREERCHARYQRTAVSTCYTSGIRLQAIGL